MVSKNNVQVKDRYATKQVHHYGIRKLSVGVASVLLGTTFYMGMNGNVVHADTVNGQDSETPDSQVTNSKSNSESTADTGSNAAFGDKQAAEEAIKREINTKPQVTEITTNDSHVQSDAANVKPDADVQSEINTKPQVTEITTNDSHVQSNVTNVKSNEDIQSQNDQNSANTRQTMQVMHFASQTGNISPNAVSANLAESNDDSVMQQAIQQTNTLRDDRSTDYAGYIKGQAQSVTLKDGSSLSVNSDVINSDTDQSAILTFKSSSFKPGDTYTILIPHIMMDSESDVAHLQPSFGTTTVNSVLLNDDKYYWKIVNHFVNSGTVSQAIKLSRVSSTTSTYLKNYFSSTDFWRPYDLIHGTINLIKGTDHGSLDFKYQLGGPEDNLYSYYDLANGNLRYPLVNGQAYDFNVYLNTDSVIENGRYDGFGLGKDVLKNVSLSIENDHDYLKLNNPVANIYNDLHQLIGTMSVKADHGKLIFSDLKLNDTVPVIGSLVDSPDSYDNVFNITFNATVNVPKQVFNGKTFTFYSAIDNFSFTFNNPKVDLVKPIHPAAKIEVLSDLNSLSAGDLISYYQNHNYMDLGTSDYITNGSKRIVNDTINHDDIPGVRRDRNFYVSQMKLALNGIALSDLNYHLDIPDGLDLYSIDFAALDHITSVILRLKDGASYTISSADLRPYIDSGSLRSNVSLKRGWADWRKSLKLNSNSSIASVDIKYHDIDSSFSLGPDSLNASSQYYQVAPTYASGKPVQVGDLLKFTATLSSTDPRVKIDSAPIVLDDVLITDPNKDTLGVFHAIVPGQSSKIPGVVNAGTLIYEDCNSDYGFPHLKHVVAYLQIPDNASLTDIKKIAVKSGLNGDYGDLIPKSISLVKVANGVTFIKVDLSNYNDIRAGFSISVPYSNIGDLQTSSRPASMLVVSDNFDQNVSHVQHFSSDTDSRTDAAVKALINQENIDVNKTDYHGSTGDYSGWWDILASDGMTSATMTKGNVNSGPSMDSKQNDHTAQADHFDLYGSTINATDRSIPGAIQIINIPSTSDGHSQFNPQLTGPIHVIDANTGKSLDDIAHVTYSESPAALHSDSLTSVANEIQLTAGQVTDWSKIKSIVIRMNVPKRTSARAVLSMKDPQIYDHVGKTIYVANAIFSTQADSPASEYHLKPVVINAGDLASAKLTVAGQATVKTLVHYEDDQGDHYVELPDKARTYNELHDVMNRSDFPQSDSDLTAADRALLPAGMVLNYAHPTIKNSNETYLNSYQNGTAAFGQQVKYDFDQDQVIFEGAMPTQVSDTKTVTETIHYVYENGPKTGQKAADDVTKSVAFNRTGFKNPFTGDIQWMKSTGSKTFDAVKSPEIKGYQADQSEIGTQTVTQDSNNIEITVKYKSQQQKMTVKYIDDDAAGKVLHTDDLTGLSNETADYTTANEINTLADQHYVLVSDDTKGQKPVYDDDANADQVFNVHVKHATHSISDSRTVTETVHYQAADGSQVPNDHVAKANFTRTGTHDEVTGADHWNVWNASNHSFDAVPTPVKTGYTPDVQTVPAETVTPENGNIRKVVTYTPDAQKLSVKFIDDTTGQVLKTVTKTGVTNADAGYNTKSDIDSYKSQHYILVSDSSNGAELVFDNDDSADQAYEVHLKHGTEPANESRIKKITVHYQYADGLARSGKAADDQTATNLTFKRTGTHDLVTGKTAWNAWDQPAQTFAEIDSPVIEGYTPDQAKIDNVSVTADSPEMTEKTIVYNADAQKLSVDFIDDTTGKTLKVIAKIGHSDESAGYSTKFDLQSYLAKHYDLVSDQTNGESLVFDHDDKADQHYEVHLTHHLTPINEQHTITETIHYQYADGLARSGKAADDYHADALKFSRTGNHDNVTDSDHWNAWTPADQQIFDRVQSPVIEGYTPDQAQIDAVTITPDSQNIEKTVTYTADDQKLTVNFIDDTTGETLKTVAKTGRSDEAAGYSTKSDLQSYLAKHYDLVSDATKGADLVFDHNDGVDQVYDVHLTHHLTPISDHQVVNETIHYVYADGLARTGKAADDYTAVPLEFNRTGKHDDVTETDSWNAWILGSASFAMVQSPAIQGYTPDHAQIDAVSVDANSQDIVKTVTYSADQQKMTVDFVDDTDHGKVLKTVTKTGGSDEAVGYNTKADIQTFVDGHYKLDRDTTNGKDLVFDHDDATDQHYEVHLTHETAPINEATSTNQVIHYQLSDGTQVAKDYTAKVDFSRNGFKDLVTNADHWNAWTPNATQTFDVVISPAKAGYTPDNVQVDAVTVEPHHADLETTVTYSPDAQKATVKYIDDVTGKTLQTKELTGVSDETSAYTTESTINQYFGQHYKLVSDQMNGKPVVFDHDDGSDQVFEVHLTHTYQNVSQEHQVHQTIHYQFADGKKAQPDYTATELVFSRTGIQDLVTENIQWNAWTPDQTFAAVNTPALNGYTPDVQTVAPVKVSHDSKDIEQTVIYHADDQTILVNYIDDDTQSTLKTDSIIGKTAQISDYTTKKSLDQYKGQHYDVVSDDTNGDTLKFDSDSTKVQTYNVHLKHQHQAASDKSTVHQTVHYIYQDGKQAAKDYTATPIEFTRTGDTDLVTGKTTWNAWTPATGTFGAVLSPVIVGYTSSRAMIDHVDVHAGDKDLDTTVTYVPDHQVIVVNYIDQVTGKTLKTDTLSGLSDQTSGYTTKSQIDSYIGQYYQLISDATNGQALIFDHDDQATQTYDVVLGHQTEAAYRTHEVHETVDYVYADGSQASKSFTAQPIVFSQNGVHDLVTNTTDWNGEWTKPQVFVAVESPKIIGFTASKPEVKAANVNYQSGDIHKLIIYAANAQTAQIKYIDDVTGNMLETDGANGHFNESIVFSHNVNDQINKFKQAHYKLVSNNFDGQKYQADNTKNVYEVHLTHEYQKVHATDAVAETVKFQYADGSQAQPTKTQTVNFGRDGIKDLVTGTTAWMPVDPQTIGAVDVPALDGYTADIQNVPAVTVNFGDGDITKVVTYKANDQLAGIKYIDDTIGKTLDTEAASGKFSTRIEFMDDPSSMIQKFESQGYRLVSNNFDNQAYQADNSQNEFEVHFTHDTQNVVRTDKVTETVKYQFTDGRQAQKAHVQTVEFIQHGVQDLVTKTTVWTLSDPQNFESVTTPELEGYTPDVQTVPAVMVNFGDSDSTKVVTYKANAQLAGIKYIDDTTGKILDTEAASGNFGTKIEFMTDPLLMIQKFNGEGYELVSDNFTGQDYQADNSKNQFNVHFKQGTKNVTQTSTVTRTIKYADQKTGNEIHQPVIQTLTFIENGVMDLVTGETTWTVPSDQIFNEIESPKIDEYENPDILVVDSDTAKFGDGDQTVIVKYQKVETPSASYTPKTTSHSKTSNSLNTSVTTTNTISKATQNTQTASQNISIRTSQTSTPQTTNKDHESQLPKATNDVHASQLPQTSSKTDSKLELIGLIGIAFAGLFGFGTSRKKHD